MFRQSSDLLQCKLISESLIVEQIKRWHCYVIYMDVSITTTKKRSSRKLSFISKENDILQTRGRYLRQVLRTSYVFVSLRTTIGDVVHSSKKIDVVSISRGCLLVLTKHSDNK